jgi:nitrite reductase/ring-hydroxylating ferredoxin subunit
MIKEFKVARAGDLCEGHMREVVVGETRILLFRRGGRIHALEGKCPHRGGPLAEGALSSVRANLGPTRCRVLSCAVV